MRAPQLEQTPRRVLDWDVKIHGVEHSQYFQGHGTSFTRWDTCATGIGDSVLEALNDALEQLASNGEVADFEAFEDRVWAETKPGRSLHGRITDHVPADIHNQSEDNELHVFVSIDVEFVQPYKCVQCGQRIDDGKPCGCGAR